MQVLELVLYGYNQKVRHLPFKLGQVNIITGRSKSGKSAVGDIIDYCLGGNSCNIADGVVRENVAWYGPFFCSLKKNGCLLLERILTRVNRQLQCAILK